MTRNDLPTSFIATGVIPSLMRFDGLNIVDFWPFIIVFDGYVGKYYVRPFKQQRNTPPP
jgi:hypothetical protein